MNTTWTNQAGGLWQTAADWSTGIVPGATDDVLISLAGGYTIGYALAGQTIASLTMSDPGATLALNSGRLTVSGTIGLNAGTLALNGTAGGPGVVLSGGTVIANGGTPVFNNGTLAN